MTSKSEKMFVHNICRTERMHTHTHKYEAEKCENNERLLALVFFSL